MLIFLQAFLEILRKTSAHPVIYIIPLGDTYLCSSIIWCVRVCVCVFPCCMHVHSSWAISAWQSKMLDKIHVLLS